MAISDRKVSNSSRVANRIQYTPTPRVLSSGKETPDTAWLKKLTAKVLDNLKNPAAIPSDVIYAALLQARSGPNK
jgi:hypothetical protein